MKKSCIALVIFGFFLLSVWGDQPVGDRKIRIPNITYKGPVKTFSCASKQEALRKYTPELFPEILKVVSGTAMANANKASGEFWAVAVGDELAEVDLCWIGFFSNGLRNIGSSAWENVTLSVTVTISAVNVEKSTSLHVAPFDGMYINPDAEVSLPIEKPGTYTLLSRPFNMQPNIDYSGQVLIFLGGKKNNPGGVVGKISSIKFVF